MKILVWEVRTSKGFTLMELSKKSGIGKSTINNIENGKVSPTLFQLETIAIAQKIDTYETSILPYEDCCTVFLPKFPVIKPKMEKVLKEESKLDVESLINEAIATVEIIDL